MSKSSKKNVEVSEPELVPVSPEVLVALAKAVKPKEYNTQRSKLATGAVQIKALVKLEGTLVIGQNNPGSPPTLKPAKFDPWLIVAALLENLHCSVERAAKFAAAHSVQNGNLEKMQEAFVAEAQKLLEPVQIVGSAGSLGPVTFAGSTHEIRQ